MFTLWHVVSTIVAALAVIAVLDRLRKGKMRERHTLWWLLAGIVGLVITIFPVTLDATARFLGVGDPVNLAFFGAIIVLFLVSMQQSTELTRAEERIRVLAERVALLDKRLRKQEDKSED